MKRELTIEAGIDRDGWVLARVADVLRGAPLPPECFVWSTVPESAEARIWMIVSITEAGLEELIERLRGIHGVRSVTPLGPGSAILRMHQMCE
jgi:hypothetical protein